MTTWAAARDALRTAISGASGQPIDLVYWSDAEQYYGEVAIRLSIPSEQGDTPVPRTVTSYNATTKVVSIVELSEIVNFTLSVRVETLSNNVEPTALTIASRIRKGLSLPSVGAALSAAELVYYDDAATRYTPFTVNKHTVSAYTIDLFFRGQFELTVPNESYGTIEHVKLSGTMTAGSDSVTINEQVDKP